MKQYFSVIPLLCFGLMVTAQKDTKRIEIGLNITNTLAGFFNNGGQGTLLDPYLFSLKFIGKNSTIRTAYNLSLKTRSEFEINGGFGGVREVQDVTADVRFGWEWRRLVSNRFTIYWGADLIGSYDSEQVDFNAFSGSTLKLNEYVIGMGGGPVMGIIFSFGSTISISTEAAIYGRYERGRTENDLFVGVPAESREIKGFSLMPMIPNSLYLNVRF